MEAHFTKRVRLVREKMGMTPAPGNACPAMPHNLYMMGVSQARGDTLKKLYRSKKNRIIAGVCGGIGEYTGVDPTVIRLLAVFLTIISVGIGILGYIAAWLLIPESPK